MDIQPKTLVGRSFVVVRRPKDRNRVCTCTAYPFPHRAGGGNCADPGPEPQSCGSCECRKVLRDPYMTGDRWFTVAECNNGDGCPWGRDA